MALDRFVYDIIDLVEKPSRFFADIFSSDGQKKLCVECKRPMTKDKKDIWFCSELCALEGCKQKAKGEGICSFPSCEQRCFVEQSNHRQYDFCSHTHATEYEKLKADIVAQSSHTRSKRRSRERYTVLFSNRMDYNSRERSEEAHKRRERQKAACSYDERTNQGPELCGCGSLKHSNGPIRFYSKYKEYYEFTNFAEFPITVDGKQWPTSEHYYQAQKFIGTPFVEVICKLQSPREAFEFSMNPHVWFWRRGDWEEIKVKVMHKVLLAKFTQYEYLRTLLVETGNRKLIEHTSNDTFWGNGGWKENGKNMLGWLLMEIRKTLTSVHADGDDEKCESDDGKSKGEKHEESMNGIDWCSTDEEMDTAVTSQPDSKYWPSLADSNTLPPSSQPMEYSNSLSHQQQTSSPHNVLSTENSDPLSGSDFGSGKPSKKDREQGEHMDSGENKQL